MKKKDQIIILKAKNIKLKDKLRKARLELADRDNNLSDTKLGIEGGVNKDDIHKEIRNKILSVNPCEGTIYDTKDKQSQPIESTEDLFKGKGYIKSLRTNKYFKRIKESTECEYTRNIKEAALFNSFEDFREKTRQVDWVTEKQYFEFIPSENK